MSSPNVNVRNVPGLNIPEHDHVDVSYVGSTNNFDEVVYRKGGASGTVVATLRFAYVGGTPVANDALMASVWRVLE